MNLDLSKLNLRRAKAKKSDAGEAVVTAIVLDKTLDCPEVRSALTACGYSLDKVTTQKSEDSEAVVFAQTEEAGDQFLRVADGLVVVTKGIDYSAIPATFADQLNANLYSSVSMAQQAMSDALWNSMYESHTHEELVANGSRIVDEFSAYMKELLAKIPQSIVKMEVAVRDALLTREALKKADPAAAPAADAAAPVADAAAPATEAPAADAAPATDKPAEGADAPAADAAAPAADAAPAVVQKAEDIKAVMQELLAPISERLTSIEQAGKETGEVVNTLKQEVQEVKSVAQSAKDKVERTVLGEAHTEHPSTVQKSEQDGGSGVQDTAYADNRKRRI